MWDDEKKEQEPTISRYYHEGMMDKMTRIIRWLIVALVGVLVAGLLYAYASNQAWMKYVDHLQSGYAETVAEEVINAGVYQQSDPGAD